MSSPPSLGFGLCGSVEESEDEEDVRDVVLSGVCMGRLSSSGWSSTPAQREELVRATSRASEDSQGWTLRPGDTEARTRAGACPKARSQASKEPGLLTPRSLSFWGHVWALESGQSIQDSQFRLRHLFT